MAQIKLDNRHSAPGQVLPFLVVGLLVIIMMAALLIDGGFLLVDRRAAQNAADAGALAGARVLCSGEDTFANRQNTLTTASNYAVADLLLSFTESEIVEPVVTIDETRIGDAEDDLPGLVRGEVVVTAGIKQDSFFAKIFSQDFLEVSATAAAGCFPYRPNIVLPIAWSCRAPAAGSVSEDCDYIRLDWDEVESVADTYLATFPLPEGVNPTKEQALAISNALFAVHSNQIYIVMDSAKVCGVDLICDFSDDGIDRYQLNSGGNRGWLNLTGSSSGTANLTDWIENGLDVYLRPHTWLSAVDGDRTAVYTSLKTRLDEVVWIPVFNVLCPDLPSSMPACVEAAHSEDAPGVPLEPGQTDTVITGNPTTPVFHVVAFAPFFITCVHSSPSDNCPGFALAQSVNPTIKDNTNALEGYFVDPQSLDSEDISIYGADLGIYSASLTR